MGNNTCPNNHHQLGQKGKTNTIDYNYENISITDINEDFLDENIPRDLLALYRRSTPYTSQRNPSTQHGELRQIGRAHV